MKIKHLINKHQKLLKNINFRNNQNYILSDFFKSKVYNKYKKNKLIKYYIPFIFITFFSFPIINDQLNIVNNRFLMNNGLLIVSLILFSPIIYFLLKEFLEYTLYVLFDYNFKGSKYIFRKKIRSKIYKNDYIIFKK